ncbi:hypothetical protein JCM8547_008034 [Rhodosporidiobolus lusitaniae]
MEASPELGNSNHAPVASSSTATSAPPVVGNGGLSAPATAEVARRNRAREPRNGLSPAPPPLQTTQSTSSASSTAAKKLDSVIYAGYEIQVQFASPYPLDELRSAESDGEEANGDAGRDGLGPNGQTREPGGKFGKKKVDPGQEDAQVASPRRERSASLSSLSSVDDFDLPTDSFALPTRALPTTKPPQPTLDSGQAVVLPDSEPPSATSSTFPLAAAPPSNTDPPPSLEPESAPSQYLEPTLPFTLPIPSTSTIVPPAPAVPPAFTSSASLPTTSAATLPPTPSAPVNPADIPTSRGRGGRFLPKPPGTTQKAQRAAARAARAAGLPLPGGTSGLTQRQQREIARKAREEQQRLLAAKERELQKTREKEKLFVCERCFKYFAKSVVYTAHRECKVDKPPGRRVYQRGATSIWEVDGATAKLYCQNLCLFAKLFIEHKYMFFDVDGFVFYILTEAMSKQEWVLGYFSKEKLSYDDYNLACIVVFPPFRQKGWATLLIEFSYELSRRLSATPGTPERPLSDLGQMGYLAHWTAVLVRYFRAIFTLRAEPPLIDTLLLPHPSPSSRSFELGSSPVKEEPPAPEENDRRKRLRRSKGWDGELPAGAVTLSSVLSGSPAKAFTLRVRAGGPRRPSLLSQNGDGAEDGAFDFPTTLEDLAEAVNLRAEDVAYAMAESGLAQFRQGGRKKKTRGGSEEEGEGPIEEVKIEDDEEDEGDGEGDGEEESVVITPELVEQVAREKRVKPMPMLDVAYVQSLA